MGITFISNKHIDECNQLLTRLEGLKSNPQNPEYKLLYSQLEQAISKGMKA